MDEQIPRELTPEIRLQIKLLVLAKYKDQEVSNEMISWICSQLELDYQNGLDIEGLN